MHTTNAQLPSVPVASNDTSVPRIKLKIRVWNRGGSTRRVNQPRARFCTNDINTLWKLLCLLDSDMGNSSMASNNHDLIFVTLRLCFRVLRALHSFRALRALRALHSFRGFHGFRVLHSFHGFRMCN